MMLKRKNRRFSIMACGYKKSGKSSFFNTLFNSQIVPIKNSSEINLYMLNVDCEGITQKISLIDTPGFGSELQDTTIQNNIVDFIKLQFDNFINEESKIRRDSSFEDSRVHCMLYFIPCTGSGLKENDLQFLKRVHNIVNIIPVISKADGITNDKKIKLKERINEQLKNNEINIFDFEHKDYYERIETEESINKYVPFSIISGDMKSEKTRERSFEWGTVEIDNPDHSDFIILKEILLGTHLNVLIDFTGSELYETYRENVLERKVGVPY
ncbi:septin [Vairimorpha necatrix]|uniref:Septin n=1 Tax=Vairimorpha necatrix TaxID=6039 RepID=A0AAX4J8A8_9MICR